MTEAICDVAFLAYGGKKLYDILSKWLKARKVAKMAETGEIAGEVAKAREAGAEVAEDAAKAGGKGKVKIESVGESGSTSELLKSINIDAKQLGKKWGKHRYDYPDLNNFGEYKQLANKVFSNPDKIIWDSINQEYLYVKGNDLLRVQSSGNFVSLYPGADSGRVLKAIENGGLKWEK